MLKLEVKAEPKLSREHPGLVERADTWSELHIGAQMAAGGAAGARGCHRSQQGVRRILWPETKGWPSTPAPAPPGRFGLWSEGDRVNSIQTRFHPTGPTETVR